MCVMDLECRVPKNSGKCAAWMILVIRMVVVPLILV